jgi:hypothetical protein
MTAKIIPIIDSPMEAGDQDNHVVVMEYVYSLRDALSFVQKEQKNGFSILFRQIDDLRQRLERLEEPDEEEGQPHS